MKKLEFSPGLMRLLIWSGPFLVAWWVIALVGGGFIPPDSANSTPEEVTDFYTDNEFRLRAATVVLMITGSFWATWGAVVAIFMRRMEQGVPMLTYAAIALVGGGYVFFECVALFWGVAAFRPGDLDPELTMTLHDLGWFSVLFDWPPFALFNVVIAIAIFRDRSAQPVLPRWAAYFCLWCAMIFVPAGAIVFFHTGPFSYAGIGALYIPLAVFFAWMCGMTLALLQGAKRLEQERAEAPQADVPPVERARKPEPTAV